jgi:hypothetical protein
MTKEIYARKKEKGMRNLPRCALRKAQALLSCLRCKKREWGSPGNREARVARDHIGKEKDTEKLSQNQAIGVMVWVTFQRGNIWVLASLIKQRPPLFLRNLLCRYIFLGKIALSTGGGAISYGLL